MLLAPSAEVNDVVLGVLGRGLTEHVPTATLHAFVFMSNHYHALVSVPDSATLSRLLKFVNGEIARRVNKLRDRVGAFWQRRFDSIPVTEDLASQRWRLRYIMAHGVKEALVGKITDWPGARSVRWLRDGTKLAGTWTDYTRLGWAKRNKTPPDPKRYQTRYEVPLYVLPAWKNKPAAYWRRLVRDQVEDIERAEGERRKTEELPLPERASLLCVDPFSRTRSRPRRPAPSILTLDPALRAEMLRERHKRLSAWRQASEGARAAPNTDGGRPWPYADVRTSRHLLPMAHKR
ncbi:MAG: transposase [Deltaproteobacteria bacterium]|nr:transposase [Deltaproteobacteria bacterium]